MVSDLDIWRSALIMVKHYGDDALLEAAARADHFPTWKIRMTNRPRRNKF
jgi:hypothetical protein